MRRHNGLITPGAVSILIAAMSCPRLAMGTAIAMGRLTTRRLCRDMARLLPLHHLLFLHSGRLPLVHPTRRTRCSRSRGLDATTAAIPYSRIEYGEREQRHPRKCPLQFTSYATAWFPALRSATASTKVCRQLALLKLHREVIPALKACNGVPIEFPIEEELVLLTCRTGGFRTNYRYKKSIGTAILRGFLLALEHSGVRPSDFAVCADPKCGRLFVPIRKPRAGKRSFCCVKHVIELSNVNTATDRKRTLERGRGGRSGATGTTREKLLQSA
jgi:hypothetical protein